MKTILVFVTTLDGKVTKWGEPNVRSWSSHQDQDYYKKVWDESKLIVMGSTTFNAELFKPSPNHLLVVMTGQPDKYKSRAVPGQIGFTSESPVDLYNRFKQ